MLDVPFQAGALTLLLFALHVWLMKSVEELPSSPDTANLSIRSAGAVLARAREIAQDLQICCCCVVLGASGRSLKSLGLFSGGAHAQKNPGLTEGGQNVLRTEPRAQQQPTVLAQIPWK